MEFGLEFVSTIGSNRNEPEWEFGDDVINEINSVLLGMSLIDFKRANAGRIVNSRVLEAARVLAILIF